MRQSLFSLSYALRCCCRCSVHHQIVNCRLLIAVATAVWAVCVERATGTWLQPKIVGLIPVSFLPDLRRRCSLRPASLDSDFGCARDNCSACAHSGNRVAGSFGPVL